jgi:IS1 family transposase
MHERFKHNSSMNRLDSKTRAAVISALVEGCSIRSTVRMTGVSKKCVMRLLVEAGAVASKYQDQAFRNLTCRRIQVDELWAFIGAKQKNVTPEIAAKNPNAGDIWLWVAIDADSKIVPCWMLGNRDAGTASQFLYDLRQRLTNRVQLTSDGHKAYLEGVDYAFSGMNVDYAMLVKLYGESPEAEKRYSPAQCIGCKSTVVVGDPDPKHISTSFAERQNLSVRMGNRRYTRVTNAFSRKLENHAAAVALYYFAYNFVKIHRTLRVTPAMAAGVTDRLWEVSDLVVLLEAEERGLERAA